MSLPSHTARRKRRRSRRKPDFTIELILAWADDHKQRTGKWPAIRCGRVLANLNESWFNIDKCLRGGFRGLPGGNSLTNLLVTERGHRNRHCPPDLTEDLVAEWATDHRRRTGDWPTQNSGSVEGHHGEVWHNIDHALIAGHRSLPGGDSLAKLLARRFGARNRAESPHLTEDEIVVWAQEHRQRLGTWPTITSGPIGLSPDDTWAAVDNALRDGLRGITGGSTLAKLLADKCGKRNHMDVPPLVVEEILNWARDHQVRTGKLPTQDSGPVLAAPGETWCGINNALKKGRRKISGGDSLAVLLTRHELRNAVSQAGDSSSQLLGEI